MANSQYWFKEFRFIIEDEVTEVYVLLTDPMNSDNPVGVVGWHHKTFPASIPVSELITKAGEAVMWPLEAPPQK